MAGSRVSLSWCVYDGSVEETNICVVVALWRVTGGSQTQLGEEQRPHRVSSRFIYIYLSHRRPLCCLDPQLCNVAVACSANLTPPVNVTINDLPQLAGVTPNVKMACVP